MKMTYLRAINNIQSVLFSNEQGSLRVTEECLIWDFAVFRGKIYLLYPWGQIELTLLRESPIEAGFRSDEQKKNQVYSI